MDKEILEILKKIRPDVDYEKERRLLSDEIFDSFDVICLIAELSEKYSIEIDMDDVTEDNFNSYVDISKMVQRIISK